MSGFNAHEGINAQRGSEWSEKTAGTAAGATATHAAVTGAKHYITDVDFWTDADSLLQILDGTTVVKEWKLDVSVGGLSLHRSFRTPVIGTAGNLVSAKIVTSSADCHVSMQGYSDIP